MIQKNSIFEYDVIYINRHFETNKEKVIRRRHRPYEMKGGRSCCTYVRRNPCHKRKLNFHQAHGNVSFLFSFKSRNG